MPKPDWELFHHQADIGVRGRGGSRAEAFVNAAIALTGVVTDPKTVEARDPVAIDCAAPDDELLFVDWLNALVREMSIRSMLFARFDLQLENGRLHAQVWGEPVETARHQPAVEIKGATYTELRVHREANGHWLAQTVVDV